MMRWFRRDAARKAGQTTRSRVFSLGGLLVLTALLAGITALIALPLGDAREAQMTSAAREEVGRLSAAVEGYRAVHYRFPDTLDQLSTVGYDPPPSLVVCRFRHVADTRNFDDHVEFTVHHRAGGRALVGRYPSRGAATERSIADACARPGVN
jgi:hypothetical protein